MFARRQKYLTVDRYAGAMTIGVMRRLTFSALRGLGHRRYRSRGDTEYLMSSPANARRLLAAIADARAGRGTRAVTMDELRRELGF
jgi:hypothetical protein